MRGLYSKEYQRELPELAPPGDRSAGPPFFLFSWSVPAANEVMLRWAARSRAVRNPPKKTKRTSSSRKAVQRRDRKKAGFAAVGYDSWSKLKTSPKENDFRAAIGCRANEAMVAHNIVLKIEVKLTD